MAVNLFRKPGDPYSLDLGPSALGNYLVGPRGATPAAAAVTAAPIAAPPPPPPSGYTPPVQGAVRGSARFNSITTGLGARNNNAFNVNEWGAGLWSAGYDVNRLNQGATESAKFVSDVKSYATANNADLEGYFKNNAGRGTDMGTVNAVDWWVSDQARRQDKDNSFGSTLLGKLVVTAAQIGASFIPGVGPAVSAGIGAVSGGLEGGFKGALLGAVSGYGIGKGTQFIASGGLTSSFNTLIGKTAPIVEGTTSVPSTGAAAPSASLLARAGSAVKGAVGGINASTALSAVNAGIGIADLVKGAAVGGAGYLAAQTLGASTPPVAPITAAPPALAKSSAEQELELQRRRRALSATDLTWGATLTNPLVRKPTLLSGSKLLGGETRLAA